MPVARLLAASLALVLLAGCARETDPARAGFFSGIGNIMSGTYEQRQGALTQDAATAELQRDEERANLASLEARRDALAADRDRLTRNLAALNRRLAAARRDPAADPQRVADLAAQAERANAEAEVLRRRNAALAEQERTTRELNSRVDALLAAPVRRE